MNNSIVKPGHVIPVDQTGEWWTFTVVIAGVDFIRKGKLESPMLAKQEMRETVTVMNQLVVRRIND